MSVSVWYILSIAGSVTYTDPSKVICFLQRGTRGDSRIFKLNLSVTNDSRVVVAGVDIARVWFRGCSSPLVSSCCASSVVLCSFWTIVVEDDTIGSIVLLSGSFTVLPSSSETIFPGTVGEASINALSLVLCLTPQGKYTFPQ